MLFFCYFVAIMAIIQWNCRGFRANFNELGLLAQKYNPQAICLQETHFKHSDSVSMRPFTIYHKLPLNTERAKGGSAILVRQGVIHSEIPLTTPLQAVAVQLSLFKTITLCSLYIPPSQDVSSNDLEDLIRQLPKPFILLGDFNSHNPLWGSNSQDHRGKRLENFLLQNDL